MGNNHVTVGSNNLLCGVTNVNYGGNNVLGGTLNQVGISTSSTHTGCAVFGRGNKTKNSYQTIVGQYANPTADTLFAVGNGTSATNTKNVFEVISDGSIIIDNITVTKTQLQKLLKLLDHVEIDEVNDIVSLI